MANFINRFNRDVNPGEAGPLVTPEDVTAAYAELLEYGLVDASGRPRMLYEIVDGQW